MNTLYLITHKETQTCYVGWTSQKIEKYWKRHIYNANYQEKYNKGHRHFYRALKKYGEKSFEWSVVMIFETAEEAKQAEQYWINKLKEFRVRLYNCTNGGDGTVGYNHTEDAKQKMREAKVGKSLSEEHKKKIGNSVSGENNYWFGKTGVLHHKFGSRQSDETKKKIGEGNKGKPGPNKGGTLSQETKNKMSKSLLGKGAKLSENDVLEIRFQYKNNDITQNELASKYKVASTTINAIVNYKIWKHLP